ncbi:MAG: YSC84-related protein [Aestuariibacter sp.]
MHFFKSLFVTLFILSLSGCAATDGATKAEKQAEIHEMENQVLAKLYKQKPDTRSQIRSASGYAVFSNANVNVIFVAAGGGFGLVKNNQSGNYTYMKMAEGGVGLGFGAKDYRIVMVFHNQQAITDFIENGWTFGGNADAAAKANKMGASVEGEAYYGDVTVYTMTESGLALQATVKGTKFWVDRELN